MTSINDQISSCRWWLGPIPFGSSLSLSGYILPYSDGFCIKLQNSSSNFSSDDVGLNISVDLNKGIVTRNTFLNGNLGYAETQGTCPFIRNSNFLMTIQVTPSNFEISTDGVLRWTFQHRYPPDNLVWLLNEGGLKVSNVSVTSTFSGVPKRVGLDAPLGHGTPSSMGNPPQYGFSVATQGKQQPLPQVMNANIQYISGTPSSFPSINSPGYPTNIPTRSSNTCYPTSNPNSYPASNPTCYPTSNTTCYPTSNPTGFPTNHPSSYLTNHPSGGSKEHNIENSSHGKGSSGILNQAGQMLAGAMASRAVLPIFGGKKALKAHKKQIKSENKLRNKALKYGLPVAGVALGAYALKKGHKTKHFLRGRSSSSSSSSSSD